MTNDATRASDEALPEKDDIAELAGVSWEAWEGRPEDSDIVPTAQEYGKGPAVQLRMCLVVMHKTKPELVEIVRSMWDEPATKDGDQNLFDGFVKHIRSAKGFAEAMLALATAAEARCLGAVAALAMEDD